MKPKELEKDIIQSFIIFGLQLGYIKVEDALLILSEPDEDKCLHLIKELLDKNENI